MDLLAVRSGWLSLAVWWFRSLLRFTSLPLFTCISSSFRRMFWIGVRSSARAVRRRLLWLSLNRSQSRLREVSRKGAKEDAKLAFFFAVFFAPLRLCAFARETLFNLSP